MNSQKLVSSVLFVASLVLCACSSSGGSGNGGSLLNPTPATPAGGPAPGAADHKPDGGVEHNHKLLAGCHVGLEAIKDPNATVCIDIFESAACTSQAQAVQDCQQQQGEPLAQCPTEGLEAACVMQINGVETASFVSNDNSREDFQRFHAWCNEGHGTYKGPKE